MSTVWRHSAGTSSSLGPLRSSERRSKVKTSYISVEGAPTADFYGSPTSGGAPLTVNFYDQSTGTVSSWDWDFGDGTPNSSAQNPVHEYTAAGTYTVSLTASNACGSDGETKTGYITVTEPSGDYATLPYTTGFESGTLDQYWITQVTGDGRVRVLSSNSPHSGTYHLVMDDATRGGYSQTEAWLRVNLAGEGEVDLEFWWKEFGDETHSQDGVYFSDDGGANFTKVQDLNGSSYTNQTWTQFNLDLDQLAASAGLSLTGTFVIKFQQYDNYPVTTDGFAFDDISVVEAGGAAASMPEEPQETADASLPEIFGVSLVSPNPFRSEAQFAIALPRETHVSAVVFNVMGKRVKTLNRGHAKAGIHIVRWDGTNEAGERVASGIYFCQVIAGEKRVNRKTILVR